VAFGRNQISRFAAGIYHIAANGIFRHGSILGGSLKACPERSRMGADWGWQSSQSGVTIHKSFPGYGLALPATAHSRLGEGPSRSGAAVTSRRDERI